MTDRIAIIGAGGQLGGATARAVLAGGWDPDRLVAASRNPTGLDNFTYRGVRVRHADYDDEASLTAALEGVDRALLIPSTAMPDIRIGQFDRALAACGAAGVQHVVTFTFVGTDPASPFAIMPYLVHAEAAVAASGMNWTVLRNSVYSDPIADWLPAIVEMGTIPYPTGDTGCSYVARHDAAAAAAVALTDGGHSGRIYDITGPAAVTTEELCAAAARVTGTPVEYRPASGDDYVAATVNDEFPEAEARLLVTLYDHIRQGRAAVVSDAVESLTGQPPQDVESVLATAWSRRS